MARVIAVCNQKGGVGKSTTAVNVAAYLAMAGKRTLLVDLDPQGNATTACGIQRRDVTNDIYQVLVNGLPASDAVLKTAIESLEVIPSTLDLAGAEPLLANAEDGKWALKRACESLRERYEFLLFDCPPSLGLLTINALIAADRTIIPVQCEYLSLEGLNSLLRTVNLVKQELNPALNVGGIVLTMTDFRATLTREVAEEIKRFFSGQVFKTSIPRSVRLAECPGFGKPICLYDPDSPGATAYHILTQELIESEPVEVG